MRELARYWEIAAARAHLPALLGPPPNQRLLARAAACAPADDQTTAHLLAHAAAAALGAAARHASAAAGAPGGGLGGVDRAEQAVFEESLETAAHLHTSQLQSQLQSGLQSRWAPSGHAPPALLTLEPVKADEDKVAMLGSMGFPDDLARETLVAHGNDLEAAANSLLA